MTKRATLLSALVTAALFMAVANGHALAARYELSGSCEYTYGPFDEIRLDRRYGPSDAGTLDSVPEQNFTRNGTEYYHIATTPEEDGSYTVTFGTRPAKTRTAPSYDPYGIPAVLAATCALSAAGALACSVRGKRPD